MDSTVRASIDKAVANMQVYVDGVESTLHQHISELREQIGLANRSDEPESCKVSEGDAEIGPEGRRSASTTRRQAVGAPGPYIPPPARGIHSSYNPIQAPRSFDVHEDGRDSPPRGRLPRIDFPHFDGAILNSGRLGVRIISNYMIHHRVSG